MLEVILEIIKTFTFITTSVRSMRLGCHFANTLFSILVSDNSFVSCLGLVISPITDGISGHAIDPGKCLRLGCLYTIILTPTYRGWLQSIDRRELLQWGTLASFTVVIIYALTICDWY